MGSHALLREIFPTQGSNPGLPYCRQILYHLSHQGSPKIVSWFERCFLISAGPLGKPGKHPWQVPICSWQGQVFRFFLRTTMLLKALFVVLWVTPIAHSTNSNCLFWLRYFELGGLPWNQNRPDLFHKHIFGLLWKPCDAESVWNFQHGTKQCSINLPDWIESSMIIWNCFYLYDISRFKTNGNFYCNSLGLFHILNV